MTPAELQVLMQQLTAAERSELEQLLAASPTKPVFRDPNFSEQQAFLEDDSSLRVVLCTRRSGKSFGAGLDLFDAAFKRPGVSCLYIALTRNSAKRIMWKDVLKVIDREKKLGCKFNETELAVTCPNGSVIYLLGMDADDGEKDKALGQKFANVIIDEAASFSTDLHDLVFGTLKPAVADYRGKIAMIGTPSNLKRGLFFELTKGQDPGEPGRWTVNGWSGHRWSAKDNPHIRQQWAAEIEELTQNNPRIAETPLFKQHYLGQWATDDDARVYKYDAARNGYEGELPAIAGPGQWHFIVGLDLGFNDSTAWVVSAYHDNDRRLHFIESWKAERQDITDVAHKTKSILGRYDIERVIVDGANKQAVEELRRRHHLPLLAAEKTGKADFIDIMNGDLISGFIRVNSIGCADLIEEWSNLVWDARIKDARVEHPACPNHCSDAALYAWRNCYAYLADIVPQRVLPGTPEAFALEVKRMEQQALEDWERREAERKEQQMLQADDPFMLGSPYGF